MRLSLLQISNNSHRFDVPTQLDTPRDEQTTKSVGPYLPTLLFTQRPGGYASVLCLPDIRPTK
jgi:hypothetical protein